MYSVKQWKIAFDSIDTDGSGFLNQEEIKEMMFKIGYGHLSDEKVAVWIQSVDKDGDNQISFDEFSAYLLMNL